MIDTRNRAEPDVAVHPKLGIRKGKGWMRQDLLGISHGRSNPVMVFVCDIDVFIVIIFDLFILGHTISTPYTSKSLDGHLHMPTVARRETESRAL